jgi:hypothetical protein
MRAVNYGTPQQTRVVVNDKQYQMGSLHVDINYACALDKPTGRQRALDADLLRRVLHSGGAMCELVAVRDVGSTPSTRRCARVTNASNRRKWHTCCGCRVTALDLIERAPRRHLRPHARQHCLHLRAARDHDRDVVLADAVNSLPFNLSVVTEFREYPRTAPDNARAQCTNSSCAA